MQQSGFKDFQLLQQQLNYKQLQDLQRQQQLWQLGDTRQQNVFNQIAKQAPGGRFSRFINGTPVHDVSQMLRNGMQQLEPAAAQGSLKKAMFSQEPGPTTHSMSLSSQQLESYFYGTPVVEARASISQYSPFQGMPNDSANLSAKAGVQSPKAMIASCFGDPYSGDHHANPSRLVVAQETFVPKQGNSLDASSSSVVEFSGREEKVGWSAVQHTANNAFVLQNSVPLDPIEAKILYNTDDNVWDAFGGQAIMGAEGVGSTLNHWDSSNVFPSIQSGSWSALMQSAVAEASSTDMGAQEGCGLMFQRMEQLSDNHVSKIEKQKTRWGDNNLQNSSNSSKRVPMVSDINSGFPGFQQLESQSSIDLQTDLSQDTSQGRTTDFHFQQMHSVEESQNIPTFLHSGDEWRVQMSGHSDSAAQHQVETSSGSTKVIKPHENMGRHQHHIKDGSLAIQTSHSVKDSSMQGFEPSLPGDTRMSKELQAGVDYQYYQSTIQGSVLPDGSNVNNRASEHVLELIHKVDEARDASIRMQSGPANSTNSPEFHRADSGDASIAQLYSQSSTSQGYGLKLDPPVKKPHNSTYFLSSQGFPEVVDNSDMRQPKSEMGENNQVWPGTPFSFHSLPPFESSQGARWENRSGNAGDLGVSSYWNGTSVASLSSPALCPQNETEVQAMSNVPITCQSVPVTLPAAAGRLERSSQERQENFSVLGALSVPPHSITSGVSYQREITASSQNVWSNMPPTQHLYGREPLKLVPLPHVAEPPNETTTSFVFPGANFEKSLQGSSESAEPPFPSLSGYGCGLEHFDKGMSQHQIFFKVHDASQVDDLPQGQVGSGATSFTFHPAVSHPPKENLDNTDALPSNLEAQHATHLGGLQLYDAEQKLAAPPDLFSSEDTKMLNLKEETKNIPAVKASMLTSLQATHSEETVMFGHSDPNDQFAGINLPSTRDDGTVNQKMASTWFKQYGTPQSQQGLPMFDARFTKAILPQFSLEKAFPIPPTSSECFDASHGGTVWSRAANILVAGQHPLPSLPATEAINHVAAMRPKKRKAETHDLLSWHKEVMQHSNRLQNSSVSEQIWAKATNLCSEKVQDVVEKIDELQPIHRSKRRVILSSQLMQQLLFPPLASFFSTGSASSCDVATYFVSRLSLGDACSFSCSNGDGSIMDSEFAFWGRSDQKLTECLKVLVCRLKKCENDIQRLDKMASFADVTMELQDLERFAVINRFAKFHARGPMDASGNPTSFGPPRSNLQKYVIAFPMPRHLPEGVQCLPL